MRNVYQNPVIGRWYQGVSMPHHVILDWSIESLFRLNHFHLFAPSRRSARASSRRGSQCRAKVMSSS